MLEVDNNLTKHIKAMETCSSPDDKHVGTEVSVESIGKIVEVVQLDNNTPFNSDRDGCISEGGLSPGLC